jgi:hypothetical protein
VLLFLFVFPCFLYSLRSPIHTIIANNT